jgi:fructose-specific component phosphotransferase system IIB-like protein
MADGPINLTGYGETCKDKWGGEFALNMNVYAIESQTDLGKIGYIFHPDRESVWNKYQSQMDGGLSCHTVNLGLGNSIMYDLFYRYINLLPSDSSKNKYLRENDYYKEKGWEQRVVDIQNFAKALNNREMTIKIGDDDWIPNQGYDVYWVNEEMAVNDPTMIVSEQAGHVKSYYLKVIAKDGKLIAFIAPASGWLKGQLARPKKDSRERIFNTMILFPLEAAITSTYPIQNASLFPFQNYQGTTGIISGTIDGKSVYIDIPFIDFTPTQ